MPKSKKYITKTTILASAKVCSIKIQSRMISIPRLFEAGYLLFLRAEQNPVVVHAVGVEGFQQLVGGDGAAALSGELQDDPAILHHNGPVTQLEGGLDIVGNHQAGDGVFRHDLFSQLQHLFRRGRVQGGSVLIQQQQLGGNQGSHQQRQRLALAAGEQTHHRVHPVLQPQSQLGQFLPELPALCGRDHGEGRPGFGGPQVGQSQIFLNGHVGSSPLQRVLKHPADEFTALIVREPGDVLPVQGHSSGIRLEGSRNGVEHGGLACAVGAQDGDEIPGSQVEAQIVQRPFFVDGARGKGDGDVVQCQHFTLPPFLI